MGNSATDRFGLVAGIIGTLMVLPVLYGWLFGRWPSARMLVLNDLAKEAETRFDAAIRDGLLVHDRTFEQLHTRLWLAKGRVETFRVKLANARGLWSDLKGWMNGMSRKISALCRELEEIQVVIAERSSRERENKGSRDRHLNYLVAKQQDNLLLLLSASSRERAAIGISPEEGLEPLAARRILQRLSQPMRAKIDAAQRRLLLLQHGKQLFNRDPRAEMTGHTVLKHQHARGKGRLRAMLRFVRLRFARRKRQTDVTQAILDLPPALYAAIQMADDTEADWEDIENVGMARLCV